MAENAKQETKDGLRGCAVIALTAEQEEILAYFRDKLRNELDDSAVWTVRRLLAGMRIDTASCCAMSRMLGRAQRDADNVSAFVVASMKRLAVEHKADPTETE